MIDDVGIHLHLALFQLKTHRIERLGKHTTTLRVRRHCIGSIAATCASMQKQQSGIEKIPYESKESAQKAVFLSIHLRVEGFQFFF